LLRSTYWVDSTFKRGDIHSYIVNSGTLSGVQGKNFSSAFQLREKHTRVDNEIYTSDDQCNTIDVENDSEVDLSESEDIDLYPLNVQLHVDIFDNSTVLNNRVVLGVLLFGFCIHLWAHTPQKWDGLKK